MDSWQGQKWQFLYANDLLPEMTTEKISENGNFIGQFNLLPEMAGLRRAKNGPFDQRQSCSKSGKNYTKPQLANMCPLVIIATCGKICKAKSGNFFNANHLLPTEK